MFEVSTQYIGVHLACLLQVLKVKHGLSQRDVAAILEFPPQLLSDVKFRRKAMSRNIFNRIPETFQINWDQIAKAIPDKFSDRSWIINKHKDDRELYRIGDPEERYYKALLNEVMELNVENFPRLYVPRVPLRQENSGLAELPIMDRPIAGASQQADEFTGQTIFVTGQAEAIAKRSPNSYVLRAMGDDPDKRFFYGDLLLVVQPAANEADGADDDEYPVRIIHHDNRLYLARLAGKGYTIIGPPTGSERIIIKNSTVKGLVKAVLLSLLKH